MLLKRQIIIKRCLLFLLVFLFAVLPTLFSFGVAFGGFSVAAVAADLD